MTKYFLTTVSFLVLMAAPCSAASPSERYDAAYALLQEAETAATLAALASADPLAGDALQTIVFATDAAEKAATFKGKDANINAQTAADVAFLGATKCTVLADSETDPDIKAAWLLAASKALEAVDLLDPNRR